MTEPEVYVRCPTCGGNGESLPGERCDCMTDAYPGLMWLPFDEMVGRIVTAMGDPLHAHDADFLLRAALGVCQCGERRTL